MGGLEANTAYSFKITSTELNSWYQDNDIKLYGMTSTNGFAGANYNQNKAFTDGVEYFYQTGSSDVIDHFEIFSLFDAVGDYTFEVSKLEDLYAGDNTTTGILAIGEKVESIINSQTDQDWFGVSLTEGKIYVFNLKDYKVGKSLTLYNSAGEEVAGGVSHSITAGPFYNQNDTFVFTVPSDDNGIVDTVNYFISANAYNNNYTNPLGRYDLSYEELAVNTNETNNTKDGAIEITDSITKAQFDSYSDKDWYKVYMEKGKSYEIDISSKAIAISGMNYSFVELHHEDYVAPTSVIQESYSTDLNTIDLGIQRAEEESDIVKEGIAELLTYFNDDISKVIYAMKRFNYDEFETLMDLYIADEEDKLAADGTPLDPDLKYSWDPSHANDPLYWNQKFFNSFNNEENRVSDEMTNLDLLYAYDAILDGGGSLLVRGDGYNILQSMDSEWTSSKKNEFKSSSYFEFVNWINKLGEKLETENITTKADLDTLVNSELSYTNSIISNGEYSTYIVSETGYYYEKGNSNDDTYGSKIGEYELTFKEIGGDKIGSSTTSAEDFKTLAGIDSDDTILDHTIESTLETGEDKDWFKLPMGSDGTYHVSIAESGFEIKVYNQLGERVNIDYGSQNPELYRIFDGSAAKKYKIAPPQEQDYYIEISSEHGNAGDYSLTIKDLAGEDMIGSNLDSAVKYDYIKSKDISSTNSDDVTQEKLMNLDFKRDKDWIEIDTKTGSNYTITVDTDNLKFMNLDIYDVEGNKVHLDSAYEKEDIADSYRDTITRDWASKVDSNGDGVKDKEVDIKLNLATTGTKYYLQVSNYTEVGNYTLNVEEDATRDDYGSGLDNYGDFDQINKLDSDSSDNTISAKLEARNDRDWFKLELVKNMVYRIVFDSETIDGGYINMLNIDGGDYLFVSDLVGDTATDLATDNNPYDTNYYYTALYSGTHYLNIENKYGAGDYTLKVERLAQDKNDSYTFNAKNIELIDGSVVIEDELLNARDNDMKNIYFDAEKTYQISLESTGNDKALLGQMNLILKTRTEKNIQDGVIREWSPTGDVVENLAFTVSKSGFYFIDISSVNGGVGSYTLKIDEIDLANNIGSTTSTAGIFTQLDSDNDGSITSEINPTFDQDWIKYDFKAQESYMITLNSDTSDTGLVYLFDEDGRLTQEHQIWDTTNTFATADRTIIFNPTQDKSYYMVIADNKTNTYTLDVENFIDSGDFTSDINTIGTVTTDGTKTTSSITPENDKDWLEVSMIEGTVYKIDVTQKADKIALSLNLAIGGIYDASGTLIGNTTVSKGQLVFKATSTDDYFIEVESLDNTMGIYEISVSAISTSEEVTFTDTIETTASITYDSTNNVFEEFKSSIDYYGDKDWIKITLKGGTKYDINLSGDNLKNAVIGGLYNINGVLVSDSYNDDASNYTLNAKTTFITSGTTDDEVVYFIEAQGKMEILGVIV